MEPTRLMLVGCGMMGLRHIRGFAELERVKPGSVQLVALCDVREEAARKAAQEAQTLLGYRPPVFADVEAALSDVPDIHAADVVTDPRSHDAIVVQLLEGGLDVICEKPLAVTVARARRMVEAAQRHGRLLATAENDKWDPMHRLAREVIRTGIIGEPNFVLQAAIEPGGRVIATAWRHRLAMGGVLLDVAVHLAYTLEFLVGPIERVCARARQVVKTIEGTEWNGTRVTIQPDAEDVVSAVLSFACGADGHWTTHFGSSGETMFKRLIIGEEGTLDSPRGRTGRPVVVRRGDEVLSGEALLAELPEFHLEDIQSRLFGERPTEYSFEWAETDRKLIAAEIGDFVEAVRERRPPGSTGADGMRAVAVIYALLESSLAGRRVTVEDVLSGKLHAYQDRVEEAARGEA
ncbi:MAG: Gfo/Idh/MocA family oxidoreductase [Armatimonadetes bacterium]|nr:Gfo/Idh/MocA family oxidoreductase [Armatimonadota bacterium]